MRRLTLSITAMAIAAAMAASPAMSQSNYNRWSDPDADTKPVAAKKSTNAKAELKALKDEIGALVDKAEKAKAADPQFLKDLRAALGANKPYWNNRLVGDQFLDGEYSKNPRWTALFGRFGYDKKKGLSMTPSGMAGGSGNASSVLSAILGGGGGGAAGNGNPSDNAGLTLDRSLPNAFALDVILYAGAVANAQDANMRIGLTQGTNRRAGYWITVVPGVAPSVSLHVISRSGVRRLAVARLDGAVRDGDQVRVQAQRRPDGRIRVSVNKKALIDVNDGTYKGAYDSLVVAAGDMSASLRRVYYYVHD